MPPRFRLLPWIPVLCWMVLIFMASTDTLSAAHTSRFIVPFLLRLFPHLSPQAIDAIHLCIRKAGHLAEYGILGILLWHAIPERKSNPEAADWSRAGAALLVAACYGASDEYHQTFVPSRGASVHDVLIDSCGAALALAIVCLANRRRSRRPPAVATSPAP